MNMAVVVLVVQHTSIELGAVSARRLPFEWKS